MKIAIDVSQSIFGTGVSDYTVELVRCLLPLSNSHKYSLFGASLRRSPEFKSLFGNAENVRLTTSLLSPVALDFLWNRLHVLPIESFVGEVDIYHSSDWAQAPSRAKKVTTVHDLSPFLFPEEMRSGGLRDITAVHQRKMKRVANECDKIICVSKSTAHDLVKIFPSIEESRVVVIPEALPSRFGSTPTQQEISLIKSRFSLSDYIVAIGTLNPRKNIVRLANAFLEYQKKLNLPEKLVIIGRPGWKMSPLPPQKNIIMTGYLPDSDLEALIRGASIFAYPSLYEGFGLPVLIAFHHQVPVVTSNVSSLPEVAGAGAVLIDPGSEESIALGLAQALKNKSRLVPAGLAQLAKFNWEKTARQTLQTYTSLC